MPSGRSNTKSTNISRMECVHRHDNITPLKGKQSMLTSCADEAGSTERRSSSRVRNPSRKALDEQFEFDESYRVRKNARKRAVGAAGSSLKSIGLDSDNERHSSKEKPDPKNRRDNADCLNARATLFNIESVSGGHSVSSSNVPVVQLEKLDERTLSKHLPRHRLNCGRIVERTPNTGQDLHGKDSGQNGFNEYSDDDLTAHTFEPHDDNETLLAQRLADCRQRKERLKAVKSQLLTRKQQRLAEFLRRKNEAKKLLADLEQREGIFCNEFEQKSKHLQDLIAVEEALEQQLLVEMSVKTSQSYSASGSLVTDEENARQLDSDENHLPQSDAKSPEERVVDDVTSCLRTDSDDVEPDDVESTCSHKPDVGIDGNSATVMTGNSSASSSSVVDALPSVLVAVRQQRPAVTTRRNPATSSSAHQVSNDRNLSVFAADESRSKPVVAEENCNISLSESSSVVSTNDIVNVQSSKRPAMDTSSVEERQLSSDFIGVKPSVIIRKSSSRPPSDVSSTMPIGSSDNGQQTVTNNTNRCLICYSSFPSRAEFQRHFLAEHLSECVTSPQVVGVPPTPNRNDVTAVTATASDDSIVQGLQANDNDDELHPFGGSSRDRRVPAAVTTSSSRRAASRKLIGSCDELKTLGDISRSTAKKTFFRCPDCSLEFNLYAKGPFYEHWVNVHSVNPGVKIVQLQPTELPDDSAKASTTSSSSQCYKRWHCTECNVSFVPIAKLQRHCLDEHGAPPLDMELNALDYLCAKCGFSTRHLHEFRRHNRQHKNQLNCRPKWRCANCDKMFWKRNRLLYHCIAHHGAPEVQPDQYVMCPTCGKSYRDNDALRSHQRLHTTHFRCETCGASFRNKSYYVRHLRVHTGERPYVCKFCDAAFRCGLSRRRHYEALHSVAPTYRCRFCSERFNQYVHRLKHERLAHGEKFTCARCQRSFAFAYKLRQHERIVHNKNAAQALVMSRRPADVEVTRPYRCAHCTKRFRSELFLQQHVSVHFKSIADPLPPVQQRRVAIAGQTSGSAVSGDDEELLMTCDEPIESVTMEIQ